MCEREEALDAVSCQDNTMCNVQGKRSTLHGRAAHILCRSPQHFLLGTQQRHALYDAPHAPPQLTLQVSHTQAGA